MPDGVSLLTLRTEIRRRGNFETNNQANAFATDAEINALINSYADEFYDELILAKGPAYFRATPQVITTSVGVSSYPLANNFYRIISVDITWGQGIVRSARPFEEAERNRFQWFPGINYETPIYYQIQGPPQDVTVSPAPPNLILQPIPSGATQVTVNYIPVRALLTSDSSQMNQVNGWADFVIYSAIADLKDKDDADGGPARAQAERIRQRIRALADNVDQSEPARVQRVKRRWWEQ